jgi:uncharacterized protein (TIGR00369 family)
MDALAKLKSITLPFAEYLGAEYVSAAKDKVVARLTVTPKLCTVPAVLHGGVIMALADTVGAAGAFLNLPEGAWTTTLESKTNFVSAAPVGAVVTAEATPVHLGRKTMVWQSRLTTDDGKLIALVTQTQMILEKR